MCRVFKCCARTYDQYLFSIPCSFDACYHTTSSRDAMPPAPPTCYSTYEGFPRLDGSEGQDVRGCGCIVRLVATELFLCNLEALRSDSSDTSPNDPPDKPMNHANGKRHTIGFKVTCL